MSKINLQIKNIRKKYKNADFESLAGIDISINSGSKFGILGPNGAGKTTLISIICGVIEASSGNVEYFIDNENSTLKNFKTKMGFIPQEYAFFENLTPKQNLEYFGAFYNLKRSEIKQETKNLLEKLGLSKVADKKINSFSGGMKRRVNLALGIIHKPDILFLDEPTVGIDVQSKNAILKFLNELNNTGTTIIYTSHDLSEVEDFCNEIALIDNGKLIANNTTEKLLSENKVEDLKTLFIKLTGEQYRD